MAAADCLPRKLSRDDKKKIDQILVKLFVNGFQPIKMVEEPGFKHFTKTINPNYKLPSRRAISRNLIPAMYQTCLGEMKRLTSTVESACLTTECWTSSNFKSFMAITVHFIDIEFELKSVFLGCYSFELDHTGYNLAQEIKRVLESWELTNKITFAVSDNAYNIKNALNQLCLENMDCFALTINIIVQSALTLEEDLINKIKNIVTHFRKSTVANNALKTYQENNGVQYPKKLIQDVSTRCFNTYYMICRFVELETSICGTLGLLDNAPANLQPEEWIVLQDLIKVLKPFEEATRALSGEKYMTASLVIVIVQRLFNVFDNFLEIMNLTPRVLKVAEKLIENMHGRDGFKNAEKNQTLLRCTFLDPRFKHIPFYHKDSLLNTTKTDIIERTAEIICTKFTEEDESNESATLANVNTPHSTTVETPKSRAIVEVQRYLEDTIISRYQDPLKWWNEHSYKYPHLSILAKNTLCCLGASVPYKRVFSNAGLVRRYKQRCGLKREKVNMSLFIRHNSN